MPKLLASLLATCALAMSGSGILAVTPAAAHARVRHHLAHFALGSARDRRLHHGGWVGGVPLAHIALRSPS